jgi:hypothetical protein
MSKLPSKYRKGFGEQDPDIESFLRPDNTDPWAQGGNSGVGYNAKFSDCQGDNGRGGNYSVDSWGDNSQYTGAGRHGDIDAPHQELSYLIDDQRDQPAGELLGGGGPVSDNKVGGVGPGRPRFAPKPPGRQINRDSLGGVNRAGTRGRR